MTAEWLTGQFDFAKFGVMPSHQRRGIGTRLHDALLSGLPHQRAVLTVLEENQSARAFYRRQGWHALYEGFMTASGLGPYTTVGKTLRREVGRAPGYKIARNTEIDGER
jgi:ribosomal protein S18 acetylase RimI-like enzyme